MIPALISNFGDACYSTFLFLIPWYQYLPLRPYPDCSVNLDLATNSQNWVQLWLIGVAILDDLLRLAGFIAVAFIIYGAFRYITSQGNPENTKAAWGTIFNSMIGLVIAVVATGAVNYLGNRLGGDSTNGLPVIVADSSALTNILDIIYSILGVVSVLMIVYGGFKYTTSRGDPQTTGQAKDTILYAIIGLTIAIFAFTITNFILLAVSK
jgi:TRAP-type C4-dicarboxylate transport system permease small subunit